MPKDEYGFMFNPRVCGCCGAGPHNGNAHHRECIIHLPAHTDETIAAWRHGAGDFAADNLANLPAPLSLTGDDLLVRSYLMGWRYAMAKFDAARTTRSLEQARDMARTIQHRPTA